MPTCPIPLSGPGLDPSLINADFSQANLTGADFSFVNNDALVVQEGMNFRDATIVNANFTSAELFGADFTGSYVLNSNFVDADLTDVTGLVTLTTPEPRTLWLLSAFGLLIPRKRKPA